MLILDSVLVFLAIFAFVEGPMTALLACGADINRAELSLIIGASAVNCILGWISFRILRQESRRSKSEITPFQAATSAGTIVFVCFLLLQFQFLPFFRVLTLDRLFVICLILQALLLTTRMSLDRHQQVDR